MGMTEMQYIVRIEKLADENAALQADLDEAVREYGDLDAYCGKLLALLREAWPWASAAMPREQAAELDRRMRSLHVEEA